MHNADGIIWRVDLALEQRGDDDRDDDDEPVVFFSLDVGDHVPSPEFSPEFSICT